MAFRSILFKNVEDGITEASPRSPEFFTDLNLDQVVAAITAGKEEYNLAPFFYTPLRDVDAVTFRHEVMQDLDTDLFNNINAFAKRMHTVRVHLAEFEKRYYEHQKGRWFLDAVSLYCAAVKCLVEDLSAARLRSRGLIGFRDYLKQYASSERFAALDKETKWHERELSSIRYTVFINGPRVAVRRGAGDDDYSAEIEAAFERFQQGSTEEYDFSFDNTPEMTHIEARILDGVAHLHQDIFSGLAKYCAANHDFGDPTVVAFDREIQFYVAYLSYIAELIAAGLSFCYPRVTVSRKEVYDYEGFDLALAVKLVRDHAKPVCNDFHLKGSERILVVSGPNQGGKSTFARTFGQLHYLGSLGCPVAGARAQLYLPDGIFTHFEKEERMTTLRGKLEDDLVRIHDILAAATPHSVIVINEIFSSTSLRDAIVLSRKIANAIMALDLLCVWVTFIDEVSTFGDKIVSMVSTVAPDNPALRTFKIVRHPADGLAYAVSVAEKYRLTYRLIKERLGS